MMTPARPVSILTIDDEETVRSSIVAYFEDSGFTVFEAADGIDGMAKIMAYKPDLVITDLRMPVMDGFAVVEAIRNLDDNLPVVVLSGTGMIHDAIRALRLGAWDYVPKPVEDLEELEIVAARCLERARLVSESRAYQQNLEKAVHERTRELHKVITAVEQSANSVIMTDESGKIEYVNPKFCKVTGFSRTEVMGANPRILKSGMQPDSYYENLWKTISQGKEWRGEVCNRTKDGRLFWELCSIAPIRDERGTIVNYVAIKEDITERKRTEEQLYYQANYDGLTGLPNRHFFQNYLRDQLAQLDIESQYLTLLVLDIDNLKTVNDTFGHDLGDLMMIEVAKRLEDATGSDGVVSRFMGDEFTIIPKLSSEAAYSVFLAERIRESLNEPFDIAGTEVIATASIGVVVYPQDGETVESLLKNAEAAMYQAKQSGKNMICYYNRELNSRLEERFKLQTRLHKALSREEFSLVYQPQIDLSENRIVGVEALLRWNPPGEGAVSPAQFIPILEESNLIIEIGEWVLHEACRQAVLWQQGGVEGFRISVNISAIQFIRSNLDISVRQALETSGLAPARLCLELTESMVMIDNNRTMERLMELRRIGVTLSLDDFGTGYSSLSYLGRIPIHELKIDQTFVRRMLSTSNDAAVVNTIIAMAQGLAVHLVAEGVETIDQLHYLRDKGCRVIQGYYFSKPLSPTDFVSYFEHWKCSPDIR